MSGGWYVWNKDTGEVSKCASSGYYQKSEERRVALTMLPDGKMVSTVFLGLDHSWGDGPPLLFETMVFPSKDDYMDLDGQRYSTAEDARAGHQAMVEKWLGLVGQEDVSGQEVN